ncbi:MAG: hypothetical protein ABEJ83_03185 [Candidatus Nanohaloarchaea archaeon]
MRQAEFMSDGSSHSYGKIDELPRRLILKTAGIAAFTGFGLNSVTATAQGEEEEYSDDFSSGSLDDYVVRGGSRNDWNIENKIDGNSLHVIGKADENTHLLVDPNKQVWPGEGVIEFDFKVDPSYFNKNAKVAFGPADDLTTFRIAVQGDSVMGQEAELPDDDLYSVRVEVEGKIITVTFPSHPDKGPFTRELDEPVDPGTAGVGQHTQSFKTGETWFDNLAINPEPTNPDLIVGNTTIAQSVLNPDIDDDDRIDLVKEKETAVLVYPDGEKLEHLSDPVTIKIEAPWGEQTVELTASEYREKSSNDDYVLFVGAADSTGEKTISAEFDPTNQIDEIDASNNSQTVETHIRETEDLPLPYYRINEALLLNYGTPSKDEVSEHVNKSNEFISTTFPVAESGFSGQYEGDLLGSSLDGDLGITADLTSLDYFAWNNSAGGKGVGVTTAEYFDEHGYEDYIGITMGGEISSSHSQLVTAGYWSTTAHELGHIFGLHVDSEEYVLTPDGEPDTGRGFWVEKEQYIDERIAFMEGGIKEDISTFWISNEQSYAGDFKDYNHIFSEMLKDGGSATAAEEEESMVYLKGALKQDGDAELFSWFFHENGSLTELESGDYRIVGRDKSGDKVMEREFSASFKIHAAGAKREEPESPVSSEFAPFSFPVPYPEDTRSVEIKEGEDVIQSLNLNIKLLTDAINSIPSSGFKNENTAEQKRTALLNKVDALANMLEKGDDTGAVEKLENDIKPSIEKWLKDEYSTSNPEKLSKDEVIKLVNEVIVRLS